MDDENIDIPPYASPRPQARGIDSETRRMAIVAGALAVAIVLIAVVWSGIHTGFGPPPVIKPPASPMRTVPTNPGGLQVPGAHEQIMSGKTASGPPTLAPAQASPDFSKLDQEATRAQPAPVPAAKPSPPAATTSPSSLPPPPPAPPTAIAQSAPAIVPQVALPPMTPPTQAQSAGTHSVQLAALVSIPKANEAWQTLVARVPDILANKKPIVVPGIVHGRTFYRLRLGGFASGSDADKFCARLKTRHVKCYVPK